MQSVLIAVGIVFILNERHKVLPVGCNPNIHFLYDVTQPVVILAVFYI